MSDRADVGEESKRYRVEPPEEGRGILMSKPQTRKETQSRGASEHRKLARNSSGVLLAMIVANVALMGTSIMTSRLLGPKGRGQLYDTAQVTTWLVVLGGLGLGTAATYFTARGERPRSIVLGNSVLLGLVFGSAIVGGGYGVIALGGVTMHKVPASYLLIAILAVPFALVLGNVQSVYLGSQRFREFIQITVGLTALPLLLIGVALLAFGGGARAAIIASALSTATLAVVFLVRAIRILGISWRLERAYFKTATSYGLRIQVATVLTLLGYRQDVFVVNHYKGPGAVGIYAAAVAVAESLWMLSQAVSYALFPRIAEEKDENVRRSITPLLARNTLWLTTAAAAILFLLSGPIISILYSGAFAAAAGAMRALLLGIVAFSGARVLSNDIAARGRPGLNSWIAGMSVVVNLGINLALVPRFGINGAAWASTISYSLLFAATVAVYCRISRTSVRSVIVPSREDAAAYYRLVRRLLKHPVTQDSAALAAAAAASAADAERSES
jgi:O-antigen/teichoic acid export membrane protein